MERARSERTNVVTGFALGAGRLGVRTGRLVLLPARAVVRTTLREPIVRSAGTSARGRIETVTVLAVPEAARGMDRVLASQLPEAVARSLAENQVVERVVAELLASTDVEAAVTSALESERTSQLVQQVLTNPALERMLTDALESRVTAELAEKVVASPEFDLVLERAVSSPAVRAAMARQTASLGAETAEGIRRRATRLDDAAERAPRRWLHKRPLTGTPQAGIATRGLALAADAALVWLIVAGGAGLLGLVASLFGGIDSDLLAGLLVGGGGLIVTCIYFVFFWTGAGQTPGMRLLRLRVLDATGAPPGVWRSILRLAGLAVAIAIAFLGFLPVLFDDRRRALQDFLAGTTVYYDELAPLPAGEAVVAPLPATIPGT